MLTKKQILQAIRAMTEEMFTDFNAVINELILFEKLSVGSKIGCRNRQMVNTLFHSILPSSTTNFHLHNLKTENH